MSDGKNPPGVFKGRQEVNNKGCSGRRGNVGELADNQKKNSKPSFRIKRKQKEKKNQGWFHLIVAGRKPTRAVCSGWSYPIQAELSLVLGGVPVLPTFRGSSCGSSACRMDGKFGCSLVCIGNVLSLAVVSTALQKLHKCVTQNTTELLRTQKRVKKKKKNQ